MTEKVLYREDFNDEEILAISKYLIARLSDSTLYKSDIGYWYHQSKYIDHFVLVAVTSDVRLQIAEKACKTFAKDYPDLNKYFEISAIYDDFNTDLVFEIKKNVDLTYIYGLSRISAE